MVILLQKITATSFISVSTTSTDHHSNSSAATTPSHGRSSISHHRRRIQHITTGLTLYGVSFLLPKYICTSLLCFFTVAFYIVIQACHYSKSMKDWYVSNFGSLLRSNELYYCERQAVDSKSTSTSSVLIVKLPGAFWFLLGVLFTCSCFPLPIGRVGLLCLTFGDPMAAFVGLTFHNYYNNSNHHHLLRFFGGGFTVGNNKKSWVGCMACFISSFAIAQLCSSTITLAAKTISWGWDASFLTALTATFMEGYVSSVLNIDDNFLIPVATSMALWTYCSYYCVA